MSKATVSVLPVMPRFVPGSGAQPEVAHQRFGPELRGYLRRYPPEQDPADIELGRLHATQHDSV